MVFDTSPAPLFVFPLLLCVDFEPACLRNARGPRMRFVVSCGLYGVALEDRDMVQETQRRRCMRVADIVPSCLSYC